MDNQWEDNLWSQSLEKKIKEQQAEIKRLKAAFEIYADKKRWSAVAFRWVFSWIGNPFQPAQDALKGGEQ